MAMREAIVDANILLRYLTNEPREQAERAAVLLESAQALGVTLVVAPLTLADVVCVLESAYQWDRRTLVNGLLQFMTASALQFLEADVVDWALCWYRDLPGLDFADAYVAALAAYRGHGNVMSFDRDLYRVPGITVAIGSESFKN
jgi:predicted nucleic acid-binding protein